MSRSYRHRPSRIESLIDRLTRLVLLPVKIIVLFAVVLLLAFLLKLVWKLVPVFDWFLSLF